MAIRLVLNSKKLTIFWGSGTRGVCGAWVELACGIFRTAAFGGLGNVSFMAQLIGTIADFAITVPGDLKVYGLISRTLGIRLSEEEEFNGADL